MSDTSDDEKAAQTNRTMSMVFQAMGLFDVILGAAFMVFGPKRLGGDPTTDMVLMGGGGFFILAGIACWWIGRFHYGSSTSSESGSTVVRSRR